MAPGHILQIFLRVTVQNQIGIAQRVIVDKEVQFRLLCHSHIQCILDPGAADGNFLNLQTLSSYFIIASSKSC